MPGSYFDASREDDQHATKAVPDGDLHSCKTNKKLHHRAMWKLTLVLVSGSRIPPAVLVGGTIFSTNTLSNNGTNLLAAVANAIFLLSFFPSTLITKLCLKTSPKPQDQIPVAQLSKQGASTSSETRAMQSMCWPVEGRRFLWGAGLVLLERSETELGFKLRQHLHWNSGNTLETWQQGE